MTYSAQFIDHGGTRGRISWALYDWAGQAFHTLIVTFVFAAYFSQAIVGDDLRGQELWGTASSISGLLLAILAPIVGAIADAGGKRKPWLLVLSAIAALAAAMLWWLHFRGVSRSKPGAAAGGCK